ncbi:ImmA/IrrE family metallo-endopeptidase [Candidatus Saccharibacteria bacterium]|nr:ImmA/IrrE family metallo-endopeptidase [Candidatus Saccharibacteria bacterium]
MTDDLGAEAQVPYKSYSEIEWDVDTAFKEFWENGFPIDVDEICDEIGIGIIYIPNLKRQFGIDSYTTSDFKTIVVDENILENENQYRLSIAHELGHMVLHKEYYPSNIHDLETYLKYANGYVSGPAESQAEIFAMILLVPSFELKAQFVKYFGEDIGSKIEELNIPKTAEIFNNISNYFGVSNSLLRKRIEYAFPDIISMIKNKE